MLLIFSHTVSFTHSLTPPHILSLSHTHAFPPPLTTVKITLRRRKTPLKPRSPVAKVRDRLKKKRAPKDIVAKFATKDTRISQQKSTYRPGHVRGVSKEKPLAQSPSRTSNADLGGCGHYPNRHNRTVECPDPTSANRHFDSTKLLIESTPREQLADKSYT